MPLNPASSSPPPFAWQNEHGPETSLLNSWRPRSTRGAVNRMPVASEMSISARRPSESRKASSAASSPSLGSRKSTPGRRAVVRGKCWTTAPVATCAASPCPAPLARPAERVLQVARAARQDHGEGLDGDRAPQPEQVRHGPGHRRAVEAVGVDADQRQLPQEQRPVEVAQGGVGLGDEQRVVGRQGGDVGRVDRVVVVRTVAGGAGAAVAAESLGGEDRSPALDEIRRRRRGSRGKAGEHEQEDGAEDRSEAHRVTDPPAAQPRRRRRRLRSAGRAPRRTGSARRRRRPATPARAGTSWRSRPSASWRHRL